PPPGRHGGSRWCRSAGSSWWRSWRSPSRASPSVSLVGCASSTAAMRRASRRSWVADGLRLPLDDALDDLVDHHCHGILTADLDRPAFEGLMNEAIGASPLGTTLFDSTLGWAIRRHCS